MTPKQNDIHVEVYREFCNIYYDEHEAERERA